MKLDELESELRMRMDGRRREQRLAAIAGGLLAGAALIALLAWLWVR